MPNDCHAFLGASSWKPLEAGRRFLFYLLEKRQKSIGILILFSGETPSGHQVFLSPFSKEMPSNR
jgi:hypothetical protein